MVDYKGLVLWDELTGVHVHVISKERSYGPYTWWECEVLDYNNDTRGEVYMQAFTSNLLKRMAIVEYNWNRLIENVPEYNQGGY